MRVNTKKPKKVYEYEEKGKRIYYGPPGKENTAYWEVKIRRATESVTIEGNNLSALRGESGHTIGCALSNIAFDSKSSFPHPFILAAFTKTTALIVEECTKSGQPSKAVWYEHPYGKYVDMNDEGEIKAAIDEDPDLMSRPFILRPPRKRTGGKTTTPAIKSGRSSSRAIVNRGALARAVKAGLVSKVAIEQLGTSLAEQCPDNLQQFLPEASES